MYKTHEKECLKFAVETGAKCTYICIYAIYTYHADCSTMDMHFYVSYRHKYTNKNIYIHTPVSFAHFSYRVHIP